jgi:polyphosphate glucokinase
VARTAANVDRSWIDLDVAAAFTRLTGRPTVFVNDADAAGLAEVRFGAGRALTAAAAAGGPPASRIIVLTFGTGIGTALFLDGRLWPNTELGHLMLPGVTDTDGEGWAAASVRTRLALDWSAWTRRVNDYLQELHRLLWVPMLQSRARIVPAALRGHAGVVGAALAAADAGTASTTAGAGDTE